MHLWKFSMGPPKSLFMDVNVPLNPVISPYFQSSAWFCILYLIPPSSNNPILTDYHLLFLPSLVLQEKNSSKSNNNYICWIIISCKIMISIISSQNHIIINMTFLAASNLTWSNHRSTWRNYSGNHNSIHAPNTWVQHTYHNSCCGIYKILNIKSCVIFLQRLTVLAWTSWLKSKRDIPGDTSSRLLHPITTQSLNARIATCISTTMMRTFPTGSLAKRLEAEEVPLLEVGIP